MVFFCSFFLVFISYSTEIRQNVYRLTICQLSLWNCIFLILFYLITYVEAVGPNKKRCVFYYVETFCVLTALTRPRRDFIKCFVYSFRISLSNWCQCAGFDLLWSRTLTTCAFRHYLLFTISTTTKTNYFCTKLSLN